jgi:hypothetical protein
LGIAFQPLAYSLQKPGSRFVGRILGYESTLESPLQDALPQPGGSLQVGFDLGFDLVYDGEAALDLLDDGKLLCVGRERYRESLHIADVEVGGSTTTCELGDQRQ